MVRVTKVLICGASGVGKTSLVYCLGSSDHPTSYPPRNPTYEDTYTLAVDLEKGVQEKVRIYEIGGRIAAIGRHFISSCDAAILVYDSTDYTSFIVAQKLKSDLPAAAVFLVGAGGAAKPCTCLAHLETATSRDVVFAGHADGVISVTSFTQRRQISAWAGHPDSQVVGIAVLPWKCISTTCALISQGRDGKIRFWDIDSIYRGDGSGRSPTMVPNYEIPCCDFTFCSFATWTNGEVEGLMVYAGSDEEKAADLTLEVIRSTDNLIVAAVDASVIARLGMCMTLAGLNASKSCQFIAGFEAGCVVVFADGRPVSRFELADQPDVRPITCLAAHRHKDGLVVVAVGMTASEACPERLSDLALLQINTTDESNWEIRRFTKQPLSGAHGVSSLSWRSDGRLLAVGQWNGDVRLFSMSTRVGVDIRVRCLGNLRGPGSVVGGGVQLGEWASVSSGGGALNNKDDQRSLSVRACLFLPSHWLVSTEPASGGGAGSFFIWDVYRNT